MFCIWKGQWKQKYYVLWVHPSIYRKSWIIFCAKFQKFCLKKNLQLLFLACLKTTISTTTNSNVNVESTTANTTTNSNVNVESTTANTTTNSNVNKEDTSNTAQTPSNPKPTATITTSIATTSKASSNFRFAWMMYLLNFSLFLYMAEWVPAKTTC